jgi:glucosylceramidase
MTRAIASLTAFLLALAGLIDATSLLVTKTQPLVTCNLGIPFPWCEAIVPPPNSLIISVNGGGCLDAPVRPPPSDRSWPLQQFPCRGAPNQRWTIEAAPSGNFLIRSGLNTGFCLDLPYGATSDHTPVNLFECHGAINQQWTLHQVDYRSVEIKPAAASNMCLDVPWGVANVQAFMQLAFCNGGANQHWVFRN